MAGACGPFLPSTNKQHLADPSGSERPSGCPCRAVDFPSLSSQPSPRSPAPSLSKLERQIPRPAGHYHVTLLSRLAKASPGGGTDWQSSRSGHQAGDPAQVLNVSLAIASAAFPGPGLCGGDGYNSLFLCLGCGSEVWLSAGRGCFLSILIPPTHWFTSIIRFRAETVEFISFPERRQGIKRERYLLKENENTLQSSGILHSAR